MVVDIPEACDNGSSARGEKRKGEAPCPTRTGIVSERRACRKHDQRRAREVEVQHRVRFERRVARGTCRTCRKEQCVTPVDASVTPRMTGKVDHLGARRKPQEVIQGG